MERRRCPWCNEKNERYVRYHDEEWGRPLRDDDRLFELLILETFQAGLSWETVLNKREAFRKAFDGFDAEKMSAWGNEKIDALMQDAGIIRNRKKIESAAENARVCLEIRSQWGSMSRYVRHFAGDGVIREHDKTRSPLSDALASDMKKRGMRFMGSTTAYAFLQAAGVIDAHMPGCFLYRPEGQD